MRLREQSHVGIYSLLAMGVLAALCAAPSARADSLSYLGQAGNTYWYLAWATDLTWGAGDVISLTGLEGVTGANEPSNFSVVFTPSSVTWTSTQDDFALLTFFNVQSPAPLGQGTYSITSSHPAGGPIAGPEYTPEPTTVMMFSAGLLGWVAVVWRRARPASTSGRGTDQ